MNIKIKLYITLLLIVIVSPLSAMEFVFDGEIYELYDDNINATSTDQESDWISNAMVGITASSETRSIDFDLSANIYQQYYLTNTERNANYQDLMLTIDKSFSENVSLVLTDGLEHYPESRSFNTLFGRSDASTGYISNSFTSELSIYVTSKLFINGTYNNSIMNNDSEEMPDSVLHNPGGSIGYSFDTANIIAVDYVYRLMKYDNGEETRSDGGYVEYEKFFTRQFRTILLGGYDYTQSSEGESLSSRWMVEIIDNIDQNNELEIFYINEDTVSNVSNDIFKNWRVSIALARELGDRTSIDLSLFYGEGTYQISGTTDKLAGASVTFDFALTEFIDLTCGYRYIWSSSTDLNSEETAYNRNQCLIGLTGSY